MYNYVKIAIKVNFVDEKFMAAVLVLYMYNVEGGHNWGSVLAFAGFHKPFLSETGADKLGLGAVLSQNRLIVNTIW